MTILTLRQFLHQQGVEPPDPESQKILVVTVRNFLDAISDNYEDDWKAEVTCDYPNPGTFLVKFLPPEDDE